jgi:hypothetical protein
VPRILAGAGLLALAACSAPIDPEEAREAARAEAGGTTIPCALDGAAAFTEDCWYQRIERDGERLVVIHHPDGGFRRLALAEGGGLSAADGADPATVAVSEGVAEISLAGSRYRLPLRAEP